jgi:hypothetical protein
MSNPAKIADVQIDNTPDGGKKVHIQSLEERMRLNPHYPFKKPATRGKMSSISLNMSILSMQQMADVLQDSYTRGHWIRLTVLEMLKDDRLFEIAVADVTAKLQTNFLQSEHRRHIWTARLPSEAIQKLNGNRPKTVSTYIWISLISEFCVNRKHEKHIQTLQPSSTSQTLWNGLGTTPVLGLPGTD